MIDVFQIYKIVKQFAKPEYNTESRADFFNIPEQIISHNGFLKDDELILPLNKKTESKLELPQLFIIQDLINPDSIRINGGINHYEFHDLKSPKIFEIFKVKKSEGAIYELFLNYSGNEYLIGIPKRLDHKIAEIKPGQSIVYRINGKSDFTLTAGKQRTFTELEYIIEFKGSAKQISYKELNQVENKKQIPKSFHKTINERKILK